MTRSVTSFQKLSGTKWLAPSLKDAPKAWYGEVNSVGPDAAPRIASALDQMLKR